ncbi:MAG TPA: hypothetical protein VN083_11090, partial [Vicinamibacteria bacterium]|nr:hypothetical protein [Vicinamibacteria bacterium]
MVGTHFKGAEERSADHKAALEAEKEALRGMNAEVRALLDAWKERDEEIKFLNDQILSQEKDKLDTLRQQVQSAQDYANAGAKRAGSDEFMAAQRQAVLDAKEQLDLTDAQKKARLEIVQGLMDSGTVSKELGAELEKHLGLTVQTHEKTVNWHSAVTDVVNDFKMLGVTSSSAFGSILDGLVRSIGEAEKLSDEIKKAGGSFSDLSSGQKVQAGIAGFGALSSAFQTGEQHGVGSGMLGGAMSGASIGAAFGPWGAAIGGAAGLIAGAIGGLFGSDPVGDAVKEGGKVLGYQISRQMAQTFLDEAHQTGEKLDQVLKDYAAKVKAQQAETNLQTMTSGLDEAKKGAQAVLGVMTDLSAEAQKYAGFLVAGVNDAMVAHGLGYLASGTLADTKTKEGKSFAAVETAAGGEAGMLSGMSKAGGIDLDYLKNAGGLAGALEAQAQAAAIASGMAPAEATKTGFAAISPVLTAELNASLQSGKALDDNTKQLIEEAKKNGIAIVAEPMIEQVAVSKQILATLQGKASGTSGGARVTGIPHLATGGLITESGLAHVDAGETFSGVGGGGGFNGAGYTSSPHVEVHFHGPVGLDDLKDLILGTVTEGLRQDRGELTYWIRRRSHVG